MKKLLLIGAAGQLGSAILSQAPVCGFEPIYFPKHTLDITNSAHLEETLSATQPALVVNTAAYHLLAQCEENPEETMRVNAIAVYRLAKLCRQQRATFVTYSTDYVFDGETDSPRHEDDPVRPLQIYGISKVAAEHAALAMYPEGSFVIRTSGLYGGREGSRSKGGNFVLNILKEAQGKDVLAVSREQIVNPTSAGDLSQATLQLVRGGAQPGIYHLASEGYCSWAEFTEEIFRLAGISTRVIPVDRGGQSDAIRRPKFSALKNTKAKQRGIVLPHWKEGLASYVKFLRSEQVI